MLLIWYGRATSLCLLIARRLGISNSGLRRWVAQAEIDEGHKPGLTTEERKELKKLRRENRVLRMERDLLSRAAAFFASSLRPNRRARLTPKRPPHWTTQPGRHPRSNQHAHLAPTVTPYCRFHRARKHNLTPGEPRTWLPTSPKRPSNRSQPPKPRKIRQNPRVPPKSLTPETI